MYGPCYFFIMRRLFVLCFMFIWCCLGLYPYNQSDKVILKINGDEILLSEYEQYYRNISKISDCSVEDYFYYFLQFKLKVYEAKSRGLDEESGFKKEFGLLSNELSGIDNLNEKQQSGNAVIQVITYKLRQNEVSDKAFAFMQDVYSKIISGEQTERILARDADSRLEQCIYHDTGFLLNEVKDAMSGISVGGCSKPFISPEGVNIVRLLHDESDTHSVLKMAYETLLVAELDKKDDLLTSKASKKDLEEFFKRNRGKYRWEFPHYKGAVIHCKSKKSGSKIRRKLKKLPMELWNDKLNELIRENKVYDSVIEVGLFEIGENEYIDKLAFKCGEYKEMNEFPYTFILGKKLDYMPDNYHDVYDVLIQDYKQECEKLYFQDLERKFRVEKYIDVLKTVNCDGSN